MGVSGWACVASCHLSPSDPWKVVLGDSKAPPDPSTAPQIATGPAPSLGSGLCPLPALANTALASQDFPPLTRGIFP